MYIEISEMFKIIASLLKKMLLRYILILNYCSARVGYRVRYFLGTDRIASIPSSIEKRLVVRYQIAILKGLLSSTSVSQ